MSESIRRYVQAVYGLDAVVQRTSDDTWQLPSPCDGWAAIGVVVHNAWAFSMFVGMVHGRPASVPQPSDGGGVPAPSDDGYVLSPEVMAAYAALTEDYSSDPIGKWNRDRDELLAALDEQHNLRRPSVANEERPPSRSDPLGRLLEFAGRDLEWRDSQH